MAVPSMSGTVHDIDLGMLDPADPDHRRLLIVWRQALKRRCRA